jgi:hypothetical protein
MSPSLRKLVLTLHVTCSVGWLGTVAVFLMLAISGLVASDPLVVRAVYIATELVGWYAIVPLCFASLATGIIEGLGTPWGLVSHYWVVIKLLIAVVASGLLVLHMRPIEYLARVAAETSLSHGERAAQVQIVADAALALIALGAATTLSVYKPRGVTTYGRRKPAAQ